MVMAGKIRLDRPLRTIADLSAIDDIITHYIMRGIPYPDQVLIDTTVGRIYLYIRGGNG